MKESPKGFITAPTIDQLKPTTREKHLLKVLWDWLENSKESTVVLGQPDNALIHDFSGLTDDQLLAKAKQLRDEWEGSLKEKASEGQNSSMQERQKRVKSAREDRE